MQQLDVDLESFSIAAIPRDTRFETSNLYRMENGDAQREILEMRDSRAQRALDLMHPVNPSNLDIVSVLPTIL